MSIHPACKMCKGACCEATYMHYPEDEDYNRLVRYKSRLSDDEQEIHIMHSGCSKLSNGLCSIYSNRPRLCEVFEVGSIMCELSIRAFRARHAERIVALFDKPKP